MSKVKTHHVVIAGVTILGAVIAIDQFYHHPTYGNGLAAAYAASKATLLLA